MKTLISLVAFNHLELTKACLRSVRFGCGERYLLLTDNGSTDGTSDYFKTLTDDDFNGVAKIISNETNLGFIAPNNAAYRFALENDFDRLILLNNDTIVPCGWLDRIDEEFDRHPAAAIVGARQTCCAIAESFHGFESDCLEYIDGACLAIDVQKVAKHFPDYLFSPYLDFAYGEDSDLSLRMRRLGYTIHQANFTIRHARGSTSQHVPKVAKCMARNHAMLQSVWARYLKTRRFDQRIIIQRRASFGDVLLTTPIIRALWRQYPQSKIYVLTRTSCADIFAGNPCVEWAGDGALVRPDDWLIDLDMVSENAPMRHFVTSYARAAGIDDPLHETEIYWRPEDEPEDPIPENAIAMHADLTTWPGKNWPLEHFRELSERLRAAGDAVILVGQTDGPRSIPCDLDARNQTSISQLAAVLSRCKGFVGHDSFPMHCAGAVGIPVVGIFGVTSSQYILSGRGPQIGCDADIRKAPDAGLRHRIAGVTHVQEDGTAIRTVTVNQVFEAITKIAR